MPTDFLGLPNTLKSYRRDDSKFHRETPLLVLLSITQKSSLNQDEKINHCFTSLMKTQKWGYAGKADAQKRLEGHARFRHYST